MFVSWYSYTSFSELEITGGNESFCVNPSVLLDIHQYPKPYMANVSKNWVRVLQHSIDEAFIGEFYYCKFLKLEKCVFSFGVGTHMLRFMLSRSAKAKENATRHDGYLRCR